METIHHPPEGESIIGHATTADCPCKPTREVKSKRRGSGYSHQGYTQTIHYWHHPLNGGSAK